MRLLFVSFVLCAAVIAPSALAGDVRVAVASSFAPPLEVLGAMFRERTGHNLVVSAGATGALYAQITQAAPFDVFLAADDERPARAVAEGFAEPGTVFTYAVGRLVLYSATVDVADGEAVLRAQDFSHIAVADPVAAPYGAAALAYLERLDQQSAIASKIVTGENVGQTLLFVESGNAELGFVALGQVVDRPRATRWLVPGDSHPTIRQDAVLLAAGASNPAARQFLDFLQSGPARQVIARFGYEHAAPGGGPQSP